MRRRFWVEMTSSTAVVGLVAVGLGVAVAMPNVVYADPSWLDVSSKSTGSVLLLAPALAALSAWDAARWRLLMSASVRRWEELLARHLVLVATLAALSFAVTLGAVTATVEPPGGLPRFDVLATGVWMVVTYAAFGFLLGRFLPPMIGAVAAFAAVWLWVAYTPAITPFWLRNVTGNLAASCCSIDRELVDHALVAPALVGTALLVATVLILSRPRWTSAVAGLAVVAVAMTTSASWMSGVGADPVRWRTGDRQCEQSAGTTLCAWREHADRLAAAVRPLGAAADRLRRAGLDVPHDVRENDAHAGRWSFSLGSDQRDEWVMSLATSPLRSLPPACIEDRDGVWPAGEDEPLAAAWLMVSAGIGADTAVDRTEVERSRLDRLLSRAPAAQLAWFDERLAAMSTCGDAT